MDEAPPPLAFNRRNIQETQQEQQTRVKSSTADRMIRMTTTINKAALHRIQEMCE